ncbi:NUDIX hydrolase [Rhodoluna sp. KAS3]|uniref:NUDIX domain-containing protein n=1 Tax=Rhodoluna sp. KAS3 TaxID=942880 RepID=UPI002230D8FD|nr:NUDIX hydrolase [Rhodoluna sp. KAS3]BDS48886.1 NTP pyrophosphohydrolase [Rhodoluna sp. KAS3]
MPKDQPVEFGVTKREVVFSGKIWDVVRETFDYQGEPLVREFVAHTGAVAVLALNENREVLMIRQYRHPVRAYLWEIPAGLLDVPGESRLEAAKRELLEETGYIASAWQDLTAFHTTPGGNDETITIFLAENLRLQGHDLDLEGEERDMQLEWVPLQQALTSALAAEIKNPSAVVGILALAHKLGISASD